ncbi:MAG: hypothetical protein M3Z48_11315, partial [Lactobacillus sp.]|nr:hypothetical protein [Lactobacillus sp.]
MPLKAGDANFFQVTVTNPQTELKIVTGPMAQASTPSQQINQLLESMNLPKSAEMQQLLGHFMKAQLPISKEQMLQAEMWLKALPEGISKVDALQTIQKMIELKIPMINDVFQALMSGQKTSGMTAIMDNFAQLLAKDTTLSESLRQNLMQQVQAIAKPFEVETGSAVLARLLQSLTNSSATMNEKMQALSMLKESGILPQQTTLQNWSKMNEEKAFQPIQQAGQLIQTILATNPENARQLVEQLKSWTESQNLLTNGQKQQINQLVDRFNQLPVSKQTLDVFAKQMQDQLLKAFTQNTADRLFTQDAHTLSMKDHLLSLFKQEANSPSQSEALMRNLVKNSIDSSQPFIQQVVT